MLPFPVTYHVSNGEQQRCQFDDPVYGSHHMKIQLRCAECFSNPCF